MTLPYALAKELKDKGWPLPAFNGGHGGNGGAWFGSRDDYVYSPSLSELIEACPKHYDIEQHQETFSLAYAYGNDGKWGWFAGYEWLGDRGVDLCPCFGETPEEAVVRLWLKLQKDRAGPCP